MARLYLYVVKSSPNPDRMHACGVPALLNENEIFFGPCKKRLRAQLHGEFLCGQRDSVDPTAIYVVGVNAANASRVRKIIWAGRVLRVMTFAAGYEYLASMATNLLPGDHPTLHVEPIREHGRLVGYRHRTDFHGQDWVFDLVERLPSTGAATFQRGEELRMQPESSMCSAFPRDACLVLSNLFFAAGHGIDIDDELVSLLLALQPLARDVGPYAIFGKRKDGSANGLTGSYLCISNNDRVDEFLNWLLPRLPTAKTSSASPYGRGKQTERVHTDTKEPPVPKRKRQC